VDVLPRRNYLSEIMHRPDLRQCNTKPPVPKFLISKAETARRDQERAARAVSYDPERARARLALLEQHAVLAMDTEERDGIAAGEWYPLMPEEERQRRLAELDRKIGHTTAVVGELSQQVPLWTWRRSLMSTAGCRRNGARPP